MKEQEQVKQVKQEAGEAGAGAGVVKEQEQVRRGSCWAPHQENARSPTPALAVKHACWRSDTPGR